MRRRMLPSGLSVVLVRGPPRACLVCVLGRECCSRCERSWSWGGYRGACVGHAFTRQHARARRCDGGRGQLDDVSVLVFVRVDEGGVN